jgi:alpha-beta hydrolase superfamily lysophospholipase
VPAVVAQLSAMTGALREHKDTLGGARADTLLGEGTELLSNLQKTDAAQENACLVALPKKVQDFYARKGELYVGLKVINDAGHELFTEEPERAKGFNLKILYRSASRKSGEPGEAQG